ncbi:MAG: RNase adapter RapZ [Deltaproteobacteria bacterium]|nr:RNase adapter RapZ [Deltaproteobacteria bacterium]
MSNHQSHLVFVAGLSGSGKTTAMAALEDQGFYCIDNLPAQLVAQFVHLCSQASPPVEKIALAVDAREERFIRSLPEVAGQLQNSGASVEVIFLDCADEVLEKRYRETRRVHPLSPEGSVSQGVAKERKLLVAVSALANRRLDTTLMNVHELKSAIVAGVTGQIRRTVVNLVSFGFRYGTPQSVELLFDMRFLPNPYFEEELSARSGRETEVADFVVKSERGEEFLGRLKSFLDYVLPLYDQEGKAYVTIGVGCTGGRHRSVAMAEALAADLEDAGREISVTHRDIERLS